MANTTTGLFQTLVVASSKATAALQYKNELVDFVYKDHETIEKAPGVGVTCNINIPIVNEGNAGNIGAGPLQIRDRTHDTASIPFDQNMSSAAVIRDFDSMRTPERLQEFYVQPMIEEVLRKINAYLAGFLTTTSFNVHSLISGAAADKFSRDDINSAWKLLASLGVPIDPMTTGLITSVNCYGNMMADTSFYQESIVGKSNAELVQQQAIIATQFGARILFDQHVTTYAANQELGIFMHRHAIAMKSMALPRTPGAQVIETYVPVKGKLSFRVQMQYDIVQQGWVIAVNCAFGAAVVRPNHGVVMATA